MPVMDRPGVNPTQHGNVVRVDRDAFRHALEERLADLGLTLEEFIRQGREGTLDDERARTLWIMHGDDLT